MVKKITDNWSILCSRSDATAAAMAAIDAASAMPTVEGESLTLDIGITYQRGLVVLTVQTGKLSERSVKGEKK